MNDKWQENGVYLGICKTTSKAICEKYAHEKNNSIFVEIGKPGEGTSFKVKIMQEEI